MKHPNCHAVFSIRQHRYKLMYRYPHMSSAEPATSVYVSTSRDHPLHMWDAFSGNLRATYRAYDHLDEVVAANSVCFNTNGNKIFAGEECQIASIFNMLEIECELVRVECTAAQPLVAYACMCPLN